MSHPPIVSQACPPPPSDPTTACRALPSPAPLRSHSHPHMTRPGRDSPPSTMACLKLTPENSSIATPDFGLRAIGNASTIPRT
eukprot:1449578-Prymnesium_polylepis.1